VQSLLGEGGLGVGVGGGWTRIQTPESTARGWTSLVRVDRDERKSGPGNHLEGGGGQMTGMRQDSLGSEGMMVRMRVCTVRSGGTRVVISRDRGNLGRQTEGVDAG
jgi:hypothetical protein